MRFIIRAAAARARRKRHDHFDHAVSEHSTRREHPHVNDAELGLTPLSSQVDVVARVVGDDTEQSRPPRTLALDWDLAIWCKEVNWELVPIRPRVDTVCGVSVAGYYRTARQRLMRWVEPRWPVVDLPRHHRAQVFLHLVHVAPIERIPLVTRWAPLSRHDAIPNERPNVR